MCKSHCIVDCIHNCIRETNSILKIIHRVFNECCSCNLCAFFIFTLANTEHNIYIFMSIQVNIALRVVDIKHSAAAAFCVSKLVRNIVVYSNNCRNFSNNCLEFSFSINNFYLCIERNVHIDDSIHSKKFKFNINCALNVEVIFVSHIKERFYKFKNIFHWSVECFINVWNDFLAILSFNIEVKSSICNLCININSCFAVCKCNLCIVVKGEYKSILCLIQSFKKHCIILSIED